MATMKIPMTVTIRIFLVRETTWVERDRTPSLGAFIGDPWVKQILNDSTKVFSENISFTFYVKKLL